MNGKSSTDLRGMSSARAGDDPEESLLSRAAVPTEILCSSLECHSFETNPPNHRRIDALAAGPLD